MPVLALLAGALLPLSLAPFGWWVAGVASVSLYFVVLTRARGFGAGFLRGWLYGFAKYGIGVSWVYVSIHEHGHASMLLAGFLVALFAAGMACFNAVAAALYTRWLRTGTPLGDAVGFVGTWVALEWLLTWVLTGFPWLFLGYGHLDTPLRHWAPVSGVLGVSLMAAIVAVAVVLVVTQRRRLRAGALLALVLPFAGGAALALPDWVRAGAPVEVALVQGNVPQEEKWRPGNAVPILEHYLELTEPVWGRDIIVWPEAAVPLFAHRAARFLDDLARRGRASGSALLLGIPALERLPGGDVVFYNTAVVVGDGEGRYVKRRLVPFGEYVPLEDWLRGIIAFFDLPMSHTVPGPWRQPLLVAGDYRLTAAICYEIVYPALVREGAARADLIVTISNDAWFGDSIGPHQHVEMARMRALENGRWVLRATNNGITALIDAEGRVREALPQFRAGVLTGEARAMSGVTPYGRYGAVPVLVVVALMLLAGPASRRWRRAA